MADWMNGFGEAMNGQALILTVSIALIGTVLLMLLRKRLPLPRPWFRKKERVTAAAQSSLTQARRAYGQQGDDASGKNETPGAGSGEERGAAALCPPALSRRIDAMEEKLRARSASRRA